VTMLTGQYAHNHRVLANGEPLGGYGVFNDKNALPLWMQNAGYRTIHIGKLPNGYGFPGQTPLDYVPPGWTEFYGYRTNDPSPVPPGGTIQCRPSSYVDFCLNEDPDGVFGPLPVRRVEYRGQENYQTDVYRNKAMEGIDRHFSTSGQPLFMEVMFFAPHAPHVPAIRYAGGFATATLPRNKAFNEANTKDKPRWLRKVPPMNSGLIGQILTRHRQRLETLRAVDDAVTGIASMLASKGQLANTYFLFTSDNGYSQGQNRIQQGKYVPYEASSRVPLLVRGPGIPPGGKSRELVVNTDVVATIADMGDAAPALAMDGRSLLPFATDTRKRSRRPILLETGDVTGALARRSVASGLRGGAAVKSARKAKQKGNLEQDAPANAAFGPNIFAPRYKSIRTSRYLYTKWSDGSRELYDMSKDPFQLDSLHKNKRYKAVRTFLKKALKKLSRCAGSSCNRKLGKEPKPLRR
jgi:N-acetylglucosamine-6-sulfatase